MVYGPAIDQKQKVVTPGSPQAEINRLMKATSLDGASNFNYFQR